MTRCRVGARQAFDAAVVEADVLEADLAFAHDQRRACRPVDDLVRSRLMVSMPSCTTPMFSKMPATTHRTQPDI